MLCACRLVNEYSSSLHECAGEQGRALSSKAAQPDRAASTNAPSYVEIVETLTLCSCHADAVLGKSNYFHYNYDNQGRSNEAQHQLQNVVDASPKRIQGELTPPLVDVAVSLFGKLLQSLLELCIVSLFRGRTVRRMAVVR